MKTESELHRLFRELRHADEASAPSFRQVRARARAHDSGPYRRPLFFAVALAAFFGTLSLALLLLPRQRREARPPVSLASLEEWKAPTDFLLEIPGRELLESTPSIPTGVPKFSGIDFPNNMKRKEPSHET